MIIHSPKFCPEEWRAASDLEKGLSEIVNRFKQRAYVQRLENLFLHSVWLEEVENKGAPDGTVFWISGEVRYFRTLNAAKDFPLVMPAKILNHPYQTPIRDVFVRAFREWLYESFSDVNGSIPDWAIERLRSKLEALASKVEVVDE